MALNVTSGTTFTQIHEQYKPGWFGRGEDAHIRGGATDSGATQVYTHNPLMPKGGGADALARRMEKYEGGAQLVKRAMINQYGAAFASAVFQRVSVETGRNLDRGVTRGDLSRLQTAVDEQVALLKTQTREQRTGSVPEATVKQDAAATWPSDVNPPVAARLADGRTFSLPHQFNRDFVERGTIRFSGADGQLHLQLHQVPDGRSPAAIQRDNIAGVAEFIRSQFGHEPGTPEFDHVANNLLRYVQQGATASAAADVRRATAAEGRLLAQQVRIEYRLSAQADGVHIASTLTAPLTRDEAHHTYDDQAPDKFVQSSYRRQDELVIDGRRLSGGGFDPLANQIRASRDFSIVLPR